MNSSWRDMEEGWREKQQVKESWSQCGQKGNDPEEWELFEWDREGAETSGQGKGSCAAMLKFHFPLQYFTP